MKNAPLSTGLNDAELVECIKEGKEHAMELLIKRHNSRMKGYLHALLRNSVWEDDALQELWIKVLQELRNNRYRESGKFTHWLVCLAKTVAQNILRSERHYLHDDNKLIAQEREQAEVQPEGNDDEQEAIRSAYHILEDGDKEIVDKRYRGCSFGEISKIKGMKENTARARYSRAMKRIKQLISNTDMKESFE
jgi:RNA polymerase sigma-70 factor (ECF subfamily)